MKKGLQLTEKDIQIYRQEIDEIDISEKDKILTEAIVKITRLFEHQ